MLRFGQIEAIKLIEENQYWIEWSTYDDGGTPSESSSDFNFKILASEDKESAFVYLKDSLGVDIVVDGALNSHYLIPKDQFNFNKFYWFKVQAIQKTNPLRTIINGPVSDGSSGDGVSKTIMYNERLLYNRYTGSPFKLFKKRETNNRCPECWDKYQQRRKKTDCATCNGTGYTDGGFYFPIEAQISTEATTRKNLPSESAEEALVDSRARLSNYPIVRPKDMIMDLSNGERFIVVHVSTTELPNRSPNRNILSKMSFVISQILDLRELHPEDSEYRVMSNQLTPKG